MSLPRTSSAGLDRVLRAIGAGTIVAVVLLAAGCAGAPPQQPAPPAPAQQAQTLLDAGEFRAAADTYLTLARSSSGSAAQGYRLAAADALVQAGDVPAARNQLAQVPASGLSAALQLRRRIVLARIDIAEQHPQQALARVPAQAPPGVPPQDARELYRVRAEAYAQSGAPLEAVRARVALGALLSNAQAARKNQVALWRTLVRVPTTKVQQEAANASGTVYAGWLHLALIAQRAGADPNALQAAVTQWEQSYPNHPARANIVPELLESSRLQAQRPQHIALLLPLTGQFEQAADAVRDGFLAAWYADQDNADRPSIDIMDTSNGDIRTLYEQALTDGADFVVGPLQKEAVNTLAAARIASIPTLALNHVDADASSGPAGGQPAAAHSGGSESTASDPDLYQFALSPEAEARRVAQHAWFAGHVRAAVLVPQGAWGERVAAAFSTEWKRLGGLVVAQQTYPSDAADMSQPVRALLHIDASEQRWRDLRNLLHRNIKFVARRRQDMDMIFLAAFPRQARQIVPQLKFYGAGDVPVYSTSHVYAGTPDPADDRDLDGVTFGGMPWVLTPNSAAPGIRQEVAHAWPDSFPAYLRLYAFGVDAYRLIARLRRLRALPYTTFDGVTGELSVGNGNRIERRLLWAHFVNGVPELQQAQGTAAQTAAAPANSPEPGTESGTGPTAAAGRSAPTQAPPARGGAQQPPGAAE